MEFSIKLLLLSTIFLGALLYCTSACDKHTCSSQVSKCQLLKDCNCNMTDPENCTCCKQCETCLAEYYADCCDCVGLCGEQQDEWDPFASSVSDLIVQINGLFEMLTSKEDDRWTVLTYPASEDLNIFVKSDNKGGVKFGVENGGLKLPPGVSLNELNCTVTFMKACLGQKECDSQCTMMGASKSRWFHDSHCCECVGSTCLDYGRAQPLCDNCFPSYMYAENANEASEEDATEKPSTITDPTLALFADDASELPTVNDHH